MTTIDDINNDGYRDVIVGTAGGDRSITAYSGKTGLQIWKHDTHEYGGGGWVYQVDARYDYNNDGVTDVLGCTGNDGSNTGPVRVYCLNGLTGISIWERPNPDSGPLFSVIGVEDFTGDGKPDVLAGGSNQQESSARLFGINGATGTVIWTNYPIGTSTWGLMQLDDINGDGKKDVAAGGFGGQIVLVNSVNGANLHFINIGSFIINRLQDMGDLNKDGYRDILVAHSSPIGIVVDGYSGETLWSVPLADQSSNVGNIGDVTFDGTNDPIIGTLYNNNYAYFLDGYDGAELAAAPGPTPVDAITAIPDIVGDLTMEMVLGGRNGLVACLSGGYDTTSPVAIPPMTDLVRMDVVKIYPNPVNDQMTIQVKVNQQSVIKLELYDLSGRYICLIGEGHYPAGETSWIWNRQSADGQRVKPGIFYLKATTGSHVQWVKLITQ
jgi:hypothetical protein